MKCSLEDKRNVKIIHVAENIDMYSAREFRDYLAELLTNPKSFNFILNLSNASHFDSSGITAILSFSLSLKKIGSKLRLVTKKDALPLLHHFQLDSDISLHTSLESALDSFQ